MGSKRKCLTLKEKVEVIEAAKSDMLSARELAKR